MGAVFSTRHAKYISQLINLTDDSFTTTNVTNNKSQVSGNTKPPKLPRRRFRLGIRQHLLLLILLLFLPLLGIETFSAVREYNTQRQTTLENQAVTARSISRTLTAFINDQINNNRSLSLIFKNTPTLNTTQGNAILAEYRNNSSLIKDYRVIGVDGKVLFADPPQLVGLDFSQDANFKRVRDGMEFAVSDLHLSEVDQNISIFNVMNRLLNSENRLLGVISASVDTKQLGQVLDIKIGIRQRGSISIHDTQANLLYNSQFPDLPYKQRQGRNTPSVLAALTGKETLQNYVKSTLDGLDKMGASVPLTKLGWSVSVAEPIDDAMSPTLSIIIPRFVSFSIIGLLVVIAAWFYSYYLARSLVDLRKAAVDFGQGNLELRTANNRYFVAEMEDLSISFDQMAAKIAQEAQARDSFLAQAAHELKTPITVIKGTTQLLASKQKKLIQKLVDNPQPDENNKQELAAERETVLKQLNKIEYQTNRMNKLIERLLDLTRLQSGRMEYHFEPINFVELLERCLDGASQLTTPDCHPLTLTLPAGTKKDEDWTVEVDSARIEQVVLNLLENAMKYSPHCNAVRVRLEFCKVREGLDEPAFELTVQDEGLGIAEVDLNRLFERYYRVKNIDQKISGLGLGLYISQEIVRQHGGQLWATSAGINQGSTFHVVLPLYQPKQTIEAGALLPTIL